MLTAGHLAKRLTESSLEERPRSFSSAMSKRRYLKLVLPRFATKIFMLDFTAEGAEGAERKT